MATTVTLLSGAKVPSVGLGVYRAASGSEAYDAVKSALAHGYRHVDTAQVYGNEADVGRAVADSGLPREEVWITSKVWLSKWGYDATLESVKASLERLQTPYVDLMLLHAPGDPDLRADTWRALEDAQSQGLVKSIGVSNFGEAHLEKLLGSCRVKPDINQVELHPFLQRAELAAYCWSKGIVIEAYSPLSKGQHMEHPTIQQVAKELGVTTAQVMVRWSIQKGFVPLPKSVNPARQKTNLDVFSFSLTPEQVAALDALEDYRTTGWDPIRDHPV